MLRTAPPRNFITRSNGILKVILLYAAFSSLWILLSDKAAEWLLRDPAKITLAGTIKGWAFVVASSVLLYGAMKRILDRPHESDVAVVSLRPLALPMALLTVAIVALTVLGIVLSMIHHKDKEVARLHAIADLKALQIQEWLAERYGDTRFVQSNPFWSELYHKWIADGDMASRDLLQARLKEFIKYRSFQSAIILNEEAMPLWSTDGNLSALDTALGDAVQTAVISDSVIHYGPYTDGSGSKHLDFIASMPPAARGRGPTIIFRVNPQDYLFKSIDEWPVPSASGEMLLFRRDGESVLYLSGLRHNREAAANLRIPVAERNVLAARVLRGESTEGSLVEGVDYAGVPAIGVVRAIRGTDWFLVAKLDRSEVYAAAMSDALWVALTGFLSLFIATTGVFLYRQRQELAVTLRERKVQAEKLRALQLLDSIAESSDAVIFAKDASGRYMLFNREASRITGKGAQEVLGQEDSQLFPPDQATLIMAYDRQVMTENRSITYQANLLTINGELTFLATKGPLHDAEGKVIGVFGIFRNITEIKRAEELLRHQEMVLREAAEIALVGGWEFDPVTLEGSWTDETARIFDIDPGVQPNARLGLCYFQGESRARIEAAVKEAVEHGKPYDLELELVSAAEKHRWVRTICHPIVQDGKTIRVRGSIQEITERKQAEKALRDSLDEKVALLKEVHHRVKNNLQIVASLLSLQSSRAANQDVVDILNNTRNRVRSMALLHEVLYHSDNLAVINFAAYARELCTHLQRSIGPTSNRIMVETRVASLGLSLEHAVPCGLMINELVSNSLKHGFPPDGSGRVVVELQVHDRQQLVLCVRDNGKGLPDGFDPFGTSTLGLKLVSNLAGQLGGELAVEQPHDGGVNFRVVFPASPDIDRRGET